MNDDDDDVVQSSLVAVVEIYGCVNDKEWSHLPEETSSWLDRQSAVL